MPGADVVVEATRTGFEQYVTIKQRPTTGGYAYTMPLKAKGLKATQQADGSVAFTDAKTGKKRAVMPAPVMWDATVDAVSGEHTHRAKVGLKVVQHGADIDLVFTPDASFLADTATQFPVASTTAATLGACEADPSTKGCRVLEFVYPTTTTATATAFGDFAGHMSQIKLWSTAPGASAAVAQYAYDDAGRLREQWDPRISPALKTAYAYDGAGRVTTLTPPGQLPSTFTYGKAGSTPAAGDGMLLQASRATLTPGSANQTNGTATTTVVYGVPVTGSAAPENLSASATASWGQGDLPTDATAIFPADQVPASNDGTTLAADSYTRAGIHYLDASGRQVNEATPGHHIAVTEYDRYGNTARTLTAGNRELALGTTQAQKDQLTTLGINALTSAERAQLLSTTSVYSADGQRETETYGPLHQITLAADLTSGTTTLAAAGSQIMARQHTVKEYDTGRRPMARQRSRTRSPSRRPVPSHVPGRTCWPTRG